MVPLGIIYLFISLFSGVNHSLRVLQHIYPIISRSGVKLALCRCSNAHLAESKGGVNLGLSIFTLFIDPDACVGNGRSEGDQLNQGHALRVMKYEERVLLPAFSILFFFNWLQLWDQLGWRPWGTSERTSAAPLQSGALQVRESNSSIQKKQIPMTRRMHALNTTKWIF